MNDDDHDRDEWEIRERRKLNIAVAITAAWILVYVVGMLLLGAE